MQEAFLLAVPQFADVLDERMIEERPDLALVVVAISFATETVGERQTRGDLQRQLRADRRGDGALDTLLRRDAATEREVRAAPVTGSQQLSRHPVIDRRDPAALRKRDPLRFADRDQR